MRTLHQATLRRGSQKKKPVMTHKTRKQREKANSDLLGSSCIWMKAHFIEYFTDTDRPNEENSVLA